MKNLEEINKRYPEAVKNKPNGWEFIYGNTVIKKDDMIWEGGNGPFKTLDDKSYCLIVGQNANGFVPVIRKTNITPLPERLKNTIPAGWVYLGKGGEFKTPNGLNSYKCIFRCASDVIPSWDFSFSNIEGTMLSLSVCYYIFPADSEIARLNAANIKRKPSLKEENEKLKIENTKLKEQNNILKALVEKHAKELLQIVKE